MPIASEEPAQARAQLGGLWLATAGAAFFRFLYLSRKSIYLDEALSVAYAHLSWHEFANVLSRRDANMALYYLLLRGVVPIGDSEFWVRLISVIAGVATVPVMYALGTKLFDRRTGLLAAVLLSVNACHVVYSQEARGYALAVLLIALSSLLFLRGIESPSWQAWGWYALVSALAVHSHFYAGLVLAAQGLSLVALPRRRVPVTRLLGAMILIGILISPALIFVLWHRKGPLDWLPGISWLELYHTAIFLTADGGKAPGNVLLSLCLIALGMAACECWRGASAEQPFDDRSYRRWKCLFLWFWLLAPMVITALGSLWTPMFFHRFLIVCLPAFVLLVARGLTQLRPRLAWVVVFVALSIVTVFLSYPRTRENWRDAAHYVLSQAQTGDSIWFYRAYCDVPFEYYEKRFPRGHRLERIPNANADAGFPDLHGESRLWVVFYPVSTPDTVAMESKMAARYPAVEQSTFRGVRVVLFDVRGKVKPGL
jgi:mannosyltransferase